MEYLIKLDNKEALNPRKRLRKPVNFILEKGEQLAVIGPNGAGKSLFIDMLSGEGDIRYIAFRDAISLTGSSFYYQQRWNSCDAESAPVVRDLLEGITDRLMGNIPDKIQREKLFSLLQIWPMLDKRIIMLSSGELRKLQLASVLVSCPRILIIDNPYIGLDAGARKVMDDVLSALAADGHIQVILVLNRSKDIPGYITSVMEINDMEAGNKMPYAEFISKSRASDSFSSINADGHQHHLADSDRDAILELPYSDMEYNAETVADLKSVSIRYGSRTILDHLDWKVRNGEKWALCGENGSGKSTLLSLICADNPQSYACDITLFDRKRGSGESIWDIKRHIGYVSPEMYRSFLRHIPAIQIVANGFFDTAGITRNPGPDQLATAEFWMKIFRIDRLKDRFFTELSSGEQHLCLLARAFVKDPELLILDEPLHCLDERNSILAKDIITAFCQRRNKTLIMVSHYQENFPGIIDRRLTLERKE